MFYWRNVNKTVPENARFASRWPIIDTITTRWQRILSVNTHVIGTEKYKTVLFIIPSQRFENPECISVFFESDLEEDLSPAGTETENAILEKSKLFYELDNKSLTTLLK